MKVEWLDLDTGKIITLLKICRHELETQNKPPGFESDVLFSEVARSPKEMMMQIK